MPSPPELRFDNLVKDLVVDRRAYEREISKLSPPHRKYVVFFVARSGSTWLTSVLSATGLLGSPEEFLNPGFVPAVATSLNANEPSRFIQMLSRRRKSPNGVFGIEVRAVDVDLFGENVFFDFFDDQTIFFNLWRENIVAQAISLYRAVETGHFHSGDGTQAAEPTYDDAGITRWLQHLISTENTNLEMLQAHGRDFITLRYEDIVQDRAGLVRRFANVLDVQLDTAHLQATTDETQKIADVWNWEAEQRFRAGNAEYVSEIETTRLMRRMGPSQ